MATNLVAPTLDEKATHSLSTAAKNTGNDAAASSGPDSDSQDGGSEDGYGSSEDHVFSKANVATYWRGVYERAGYENRHRFDPHYVWTAEEEKKLVRKIDWRIMTWAWIMFCALDIHRRNINRAISDNMLPELGK
jgi:hypothetical protein